MENIKVHKKTLVLLSLANCGKVTGALESILGFEKFEMVNLLNPIISGTPSHFKKSDLPSLRRMLSSDEICGTQDVLSLRDAQRVMQERYNLMKHFPTMFDNMQWYLSRASRDWFPTFHG